MNLTAPTTSPRPTRRHRASFLGTLGVVTVLLPALLAGCSSDDDATSASTPAAGGSSTSAQMGRCLRDAGYDVDDPDLGQGMVVAAPRGVDPVEYSEAFATCRSALRESDGGGNPTTDDAAAWQESQLKVAQCVRDEGFEDFPDPVDGQFPGKMFSTGDGTPEQDAFFACSEQFDPDATGSDE